MMLTYEAEGFVYYVEDKEVILDKYVGKDTDVVVPDTIDKCKVTKISIQTFCKNESITSITIPDTVTEIWEFAFKGCKSLKKVVLPKTLTLLERGAFELCESLEEVDIAKENENFKTVDGVVYTANMSTLVYYPAAKKGDEYNVAYGAEIIGSYAFADNNFLKKVIIPETVEDIDGWAFFRSKNLEVVDAGSGIKRIGVFAFGECKKIREFTIPEGVSALESSAFYDCISLKKLVCPKGFKGAGKYALHNCPIGELHLHKGTRPMNVLSDVENEFLLCITYEDDREVRIMFNRAYFYSRFQIETAGALDIKKYDKFFKNAVRGMSKAESKNVALCRIFSNDLPEPAQAELYIDFLKGCDIDESIFESDKINEKNAELVSKLASQLGYSAKAAEIFEKAKKKKKDYSL